MVEVALISVVSSRAIPPHIGLENNITTPILPDISQAHVLPLFERSLTTTVESLGQNERPWRVLRITRNPTVFAVAIKSRIQAIDYDVIILVRCHSSRSTPHVNAILHRNYPLAPYTPPRGQVPMLTRSLANTRATPPFNALLPSRVLFVTISA